jgi:tripartite-type tricarboxylate transporter receptor subunit TctC
MRKKSFRARERIGSNVGKNGVVPGICEKSRHHASIAIIGSLAVLLLASPFAMAQKSAYPARPIRIIVPFAPGGGTDVLARVLTQKVAESINASVVVDNRGGSGGIIGCEIAVKSAPDGYTLVFDTASYTTRAALYNLPFHAINDITPVIQAFSSGYILVLPPGNNVPVKSIKELIAYATANPTKLNYGSSGVGSFLHLGTELLLLMGNIKMNHVPYKGAGPALNDLMGGQIQFVMGSLTVAGPLMKANRLRGLAVTTAKRWPEFPDLPAVAETIPGYEAAVWYGMWAPKNLDRKIVALWNNEVGRILSQPELKPRWAVEGVEPAGGTPEAFMRLIQSDIVKWTKVAIQANLKGKI